MRNLTRRRLVPVLAAVLFAGALGFGTVQAAASPSAPTSAAACDLKKCFEACQAQYGEGATPYCTASGDCGCIL
jgi:hypothetical protein